MGWFQKSYLINRVGQQNLMFAYKVGGWSRKGPKYAYVMYELSQSYPGRIHSLLQYTSKCARIHVLPSLKQQQK